MNKTRFYEILQAAKKGEDLKQFVPTNAPEAALIASLSGGGNGGSAGGASMVPTYFKFNNPNIKNMYYGMTIPTWNKVKLNVASVFDVFARRHHNMSLEELCNSENAVDLIYEISSNGTPKIFELYQLKYYDVDEYNDSPSFDGVDSSAISMCVVINDYGNSDDDCGFELRFQVQQGSGNYEHVVVNINTAAGNLYSEFVNAGTIEYNIGQYRFDGYTSGDVAPTVYFIFNIFNTIDLNKLEKFDAISFE